jgi:hypothetical protein
MPVVIVPSQTGVALNELVRRTRFILEDYPLQDQIAVPVTTVIQATVDILDKDTWDVGVRMEFDDGTGEQVWIGAQSGTTLQQLRRGAYGTTPALHNATCYVLREPAYGYTQISEALMRVCDTDFRNVLWAVTTGTATPTTTDVIYPMPTGFQGIISITQRKTTTPTDSIDYLSKGSGLPVTILRDVDPNLSSSGIALRIPAVDNTTYPLQITYGADVTINSISDGPMAEAALMGACSRVVASKDAYRTRQDVSQGDATVTPGANVRTASWFWSQMLEARRRAKEELLRRGALRT